MTSIAITMMIVALLVIWGGLIFSLIRLPKEEEKQKNKELKKAAETEKKEQKKQAGEAKKAQKANKPKKVKPIRQALLMTEYYNILLKKRICM